MCNDVLRILTLIIFGIASGMLVNYLVDTLPWKRRLAKPFCLNCDAPQPLVNYLLVPRRCTQCSTPRSWRTWLVEIIFVALAQWTAYLPANKLGFWLGWLILVYFGIVAVIDIEHRLILHPVSWAGVGLGLAIGMVRNGWLDTLIGGAVGFGLMWLLYRLGDTIMRGVARLRKQTLEEVALGFGDVNLSGIIGLMLGWPLVAWGLFLTAVIGALVSLAYLIIMVVQRRYRWDTALPYGPYLVAAAFLLLFLGEPLLALLGQ
jgi:prepilin signal peptidase PulO-like enzyme (type II secretory pathway)